jgi:hypothetical protein
MSEPTTEQLRALADEARADARHHASVTASPNTLEADAIGAAYWLRRRADRIDATTLLDTARAAGLYDGPEGDWKYDHDLRAALHADRPVVSARGSIERREHTRDHLAQFTKGAPA